MTGLSRYDSDGDIETLEYCYNKLQVTMDKGKRERLQEMINELKCKKGGRAGKKRGLKVTTAGYMPPAL